jgi:hypothetical protein
MRTAGKRKQNALSAKLNCGDIIITKELVQGTISAFESEAREPSLLVLLEYARVANISVECLIDDGLDLPEKLPASPKSEGVRRKKSSRK